MTILLPDGSTYTLLCTIPSSSPAHVVTKLFVKIRFALNSRLQLVCVASTLHEEVLGEMKFLAISDESRNPHLPVGTLERIKYNKTRVFVRTGLGIKKQQFEKEVQLVFSMWKMMMCKESKKSGYKVSDLINDLKDEIAVDGGKLCKLADRYNAIFTNSQNMVYLNAPSNIYWSELLRLSPDVISLDSLHHLPLSPVNLEVTVGNNNVVLRDLQGMLLPSDQNEGNIFDVKFKFSNSGSGFSIKLHNSKIKVPPEGLVIPLTLSMRVDRNTKKLTVVGTMGSWKKFRANFSSSKGGDCFQTYDDEDLELLLDNTPPTIYSTVIEEDNIVTLEE